MLIREQVEERLQVASSVFNLVISSLAWILLNAPC